jgi:RNA polymerase sigma factor for flagellar operon FliA
MIDWLRSLDPNAREARNASRRVARSIARLTQELGRSPRDEEVAKALGIGVEDYRRTLAERGRPCVARLEHVELTSTFPPSDTELPDEVATQRMLGAQVSDALDRLPERLRRVMSLYYREDRTLREIGAALNVSESRVSQLHSEAMVRIREAVGIAA